MSTGKKLTTLTMEQRLHVLDDLKIMHCSAVAEKYNVSVRTISRIKTSAAEISRFRDQNMAEKKRQRIKAPVYEELDQQLYAWFTERRAMGGLLTDKLLLEKASELRDTLGSCSSSKLSEGWLAVFKRRHSIRLVQPFRRTPSADEDEAKRFVEEFKKLMEDAQINDENIYNMDEMDLLWRALPSKILAQRTEKGHKSRITVAFCANSTGKHKLMPLVINRFPNRYTANHCHTKLPVILKAQPHAWMTQTLFFEWYENHFKPAVQSYQATNKIVGKNILLLDNCTSHRVPTIVTDTESFKIVFIPPNVTSLIQPMDQGIKANIKLLYRHKMLQRVATHAGGVNEFYSRYTLKDCVQLLGETWTEITPGNIINAWSKLITTPRNIYHRDMQRAMSIISGDTCSEEDVRDFLSTCEDAENQKSTESDSEEESEEDSEEESEDGDKEEENEEPTEQLENYRKNELKQLLHRLDEYVSRAGTLAQGIFHALENHLLSHFNVADDVTATVSSQETQNERFKRKTPAVRRFKRRQRKEQQNEIDSDLEIVSVEEPAKNSSLHNQDVNYRINAKVVRRSRRPQIIKRKRQQTDVDSDVEIVSMGEFKQTLQKLKEKIQRKEANESSSHNEEDNYEINLQVLWRSKDIHRLNIRRMESFQKVYQYFANLEGVTVENILITRNDTTIRRTETPVSIELSITDTIEGGIVHNSGDSISTKKEESERTCRIRVQGASRKSSFIHIVQMDENFHSLARRCAERFEVEVGRIKFVFDGEVVHLAETPDILEIEDEACFDLHISPLFISCL